MIAAALIGIAVFLLVPGPSQADRRMRNLRPTDEVDKPANPHLMRIVFIGMGFVAFLLLEGLIGIIAGITVAFVGPALIAKFEPRRVREERQALLRQAPQVADLLAACVSSGATLRDSTAAVSQAIGPPAKSTLDAVVAALDLGASPAEAWRPHSDQPGFGPMARAITRSADSGAPLRDVLTSIADDARRSRRTTLEVAARTAGVRAVAPLAACFLPAFLILGVVPVVVELGRAFFT